MGAAPSRAVSWAVRPAEWEWDYEAVCGGAPGAGRSPSHRELAGELPGPPPLSCLQRSTSQPLALLLHLKGSERLTVYWLPG